MRVYLAIMYSFKAGAQVLSAFIVNADSQDEAATTITKTMMDRWPVAEGYDGHSWYPIEDCTDYVIKIVRAILKVSNE
jgi:hypothetical protein